MRGPLVVGVDPGLRDTGLVLVDRRELLSARTVSRDGPPVPIGQQLTGRAGLDYLDALAVALDELAAAATALDAGRRQALAVEDVVNPSPHLGTTNPAGILGTAVVLGYVLSWAAGHGLDLVTVRPNRNGSGVPQQYPAELLDRGGKVLPGGKRRHQRSAYDVAIAGHSLHNLGLRAAV